MAGLAHSAAHFFKFLFILVLYTLTMTLWVRVLFMYIYVPLLTCKHHRISSSRRFSTMGVLRF